MRRAVALPRGWPRLVKSAVLHVASLAHLAMAHAHGWAANSINARVRLAAENSRLRSELAMLREELRIMAAIPPHRRPHYAPTARMAILELKAARAWSLAQTAKAFLLEPETIAAWLKRLDESGPAALVRLPQPVNRFPDFVRHIVARFKVLCPTIGKVKLAQTLARAGLHLGATTVGRMLKGGTRDFGERCRAVSPVNASSQPAKARRRIVTAQRPDHVWHVDLTVVPTGSGFWAPWLPFALPQRWPFCWWVVCAVDHFSRKVMGAAVFRKQPNGEQVRAFLAGVIRRNKATPRYIVCDKGGQFWCKPFKRWCRRRKIKPRFGAIGQHGSIAVIERFIRSFKDEAIRGIIVPLSAAAMRKAVSSYLFWYNHHRPHTALAGRTPEERYRRISSACRRPRYEPRPLWPRDSLCASPAAKVRGDLGAKLALNVTWHDQRKHLPIVTLRRVA
jgi:putative transposase